ncbi:molybdopterin-dependent oxidoreductase [Sphingopyxis sp.]|uniref:molybdopterin-dependent oxidoreductase n=1 Tax=Sphingopyxis sp. TaxID=1908224 RepID=UPI002D77AB66|nr:molybdopterin-dependent oxidoreductase [Sphingopyxis sp.]HET6522864.1 molybdopterin-dependent oxidoreductase [Sphingopyxis sp.]
MTKLLHRRQILLGAGGLAATTVAGLGVRQLASPEGAEPWLRFGDTLGRKVQRAFLAHRPLAPEYRLDQMSAKFPTNGGFGASYIEPDPAFDKMASNGFLDYRLQVEGLVKRPASFSLRELRSMPQRTQITMHCCDMGWSAIGQWTGVPLGWLLQHVGLMDNARYIFFFAMDRYIGFPVNYHTSIDLLDAFHPQTILAYGMNGDVLPREYGAPLRLRTELQVGYKNAKHLARIVAVDSLSRFGKGHGGFAEDFGYQWYAGM